MPAGSAAPFRTIGIVGLGLIGGSIAWDLRRQQPEARLIGVDESAVTGLALANGAIHESRSGPSELLDADLVIVATPVPTISAVLQELGRARFGGIVSDVGSTKRVVMSAAVDAGVARFVGGHPMAGTEGRGFTQARPGLFEGRPWFIVESGAADAVADGQSIAALVRAIGANPVTCTAERHDRLVAFVSHLPQLLAVALMNTAVDGTGEKGLEHSGRAFIEMTRLARSPGDLWAGILDSNGDFVSEAVQTFIEHLEPLARGDAKQRVEAFARASGSSPSGSAPIA